MQQSVAGLGAAIFMPPKLSGSVVTLHLRPLGCAVTLANLGCFHKTNSSQYPTKSCQCTWMTSSSLDQSASLAKLSLGLVYYLQACHILGSNIVFFHSETALLLPGCSAQKESLLLMLTQEVDHGALLTPTWLLGTPPEPGASFRDTG